MGLPNIATLKQRFLASRQLLPGDWANAHTDLLTSYQGNIIALAGGGRAGSPVINAAYNELVTVASANDSVQLPPAKVGLCITITNSGANSAQIFANGSDTINGTAGNVGVALAAAATAEYVCTKDGIWKRYTSA